MVEVLLGGEKFRVVIGIVWGVVGFMVIVDVKVGWIGVEMVVIVEGFEVIGGKIVVEIEFVEEREEDMEELEVIGFVIYVKIEM